MSKDMELMVTIPVFSKYYIEFLLENPYGGPENAKFVFRLTDGVKIYGYDDINYAILMATVLHNDYSNIAIILTALAANTIINSSVSFNEYNEFSEEFYHLKEYTSTCLKAVLAYSKVIEGKSNDIMTRDPIVEDKITFRRPSSVGEKIVNFPDIAKGINNDNTITIDGYGSNYCLKSIANDDIVIIILRPKIISKDNVNYSTIPISIKYYIKLENKFTFCKDQLIELLTKFGFKIDKIKNVLELIDFVKDAMDKASNE